MANLQNVGRELGFLEMYFEFQTEIHIHLERIKLLPFFKHQLYKKTLLSSNNNTSGEGGQLLTLDRIQKALVLPTDSSQV